MNKVQRPATILIVDDDPDLLELIGIRLSSAGYKVISASSGLAALEAFRVERPQVVLTDLRMENIDGFALFEHIHAEAPGIPVIILTAHGTIPEAVAATQAGVYGFLTKPFDGQELLARIADAVAISPAVESEQCKEEWRQSIISANAEMNEMLLAAKRMADGAEALLITGPSGNGKEILAQAIHDISDRSEFAFGLLNCSALANEADAAKQLDAMIDLSEGGTVFIKDIDLLPLGMQYRLLPHVGNIGLFQKTSRSVRVIAACKTNLEAEVHSGKFRQDLYYALKRNALHIPALSKRPEDIPLLVAHFTQTWVEQFKSKASAFAPDALIVMQNALWPGNVRQLRFVTESALTMAVSSIVPASLVRRLVQDDNEREMATFDDARKHFEYDYLLRLLKATRGNVAQAARIAQRNRTEFYRLLARHQIDANSFK